jgi:4-alpha-glucanotransferase
MNLATEKNKMVKENIVPEPVQAFDGNDKEINKKEEKKKKQMNQVKTEKDIQPSEEIKPEIIEAKADAPKKTAKRLTTPKKEATTKPAVEKKTSIKQTEAKEVPKKTTLKKKGVIKEEKATTVKITFVVRFHTKFGQSLFISGAHEIFGNNHPANALPMQYLNDQLWTVTIDLNKFSIPKEGIVYNYMIRYEDNSVSYDWGSDKILSTDSLASEEILIIDSWNFAGYFENAFYTEPFKHVLLKSSYTPVKVIAPKTYSHIFKAKAPLLKKGETLCIVGNDIALGSWNENDVLLMNRKEDEDFFSAKVNLSKAFFPITYKYGIYNIAEKKIVRYEDGNNRVLYDAFVKNKKTIVNDGFAVLPGTSWRGAGVAIPVFSLRSKQSCGVGEFTDIKLLVDWARSVGLKLIQILPVNDTTATHTWKDSYPYSAISAFALHPMFLNLSQVAGTEHADVLTDISEEQQRLNKLDIVDYEAVNKLKWKVIKKLYPLQKEKIFNSADYKQYFQINKEWLIPYTAFCYFRDKYNSADFNTWQSHTKYNADEVVALLDPSSPSYNDIAIHLYVQYLLHLQLKDATQYAHENGVILKGDIPIGIYRYGSDAWQHPDLYHMDMQAGAPPDDFAITGQNWGFPTYNWEKMKENDFAWWKQRFEQMSYYFDAFRIDHILGFFRIWSIPVHSLEGIMGHFEPAIPVHLHEFNQRNTWFDYHRYCKPYITEQLLNETFGDQKDHVKYTFLNYNGFEKYQMKPEFDTQNKVENYFSWQQDNAHNQWLKKQLFGLIANVILFEVEGSNGQQFHFRFGIEETSSFKELDAHTQYQLKELYVDYFFKRQDDFWKQIAMQKLPALKRATNMLVCGEDLGLVPRSVPDVMRQLGLLSLEIQRMPKDPKRTFFHPADAPYLSVVTPSTHDMSTIRGWWEENRDLSQQFFNDELGQWGSAPYFCDAWVNKLIVVQHLYSPSMWSIFQLQDILGINRKIRRPNPHEERINIPADPKHFWKYRMHLTLEDLIKATEFNNEFSTIIKESGRV